MQSHSSHRRRQFLRSIGAAGVVSLAGLGNQAVTRAFAQAGPAGGVIALTPSLSLIVGIGGNVVVATQPEATAIVDSGAAEHERVLLDFLAELSSGRPVQALFNTHWHLDHTGANGALAHAGAEIIAHENTRLWMSTQFYVRWEDRVYEPRAKAALPTLTFFSSDPQPRVLDLDGRRIEYGHLENAHTDGDIYVFFPDENVLVTGGAVAVGEYPIPDYSTGGWIDGLADATQALLNLADAQTLIVPGVGSVQDRAHLAAQHEMVTTLRERIAERMRLGQGVDEMMAQGITDDFDERWGGTPLGRVFVANAYADLAWRGPGGSL